MRRLLLIILLLIPVAFAIPEINDIHISETSEGYSFYVDATKNGNYTKSVVDPIITLHVRIKGNDEWKILRTPSLSLYDDPKKGVDMEKLYYKFDWNAFSPSQIRDGFILEVEGLATDVDDNDKFDKEFATGKRKITGEKPDLLINEVRQTFSYVNDDDGPFSAYAAFRITLKNQGQPVTFYESYPEIGLTFDGRTQRTSIVQYVRERKHRVFTPGGETLEYVSADRPTITLDTNDEYVVIWEYPVLSYKSHLQLKGGDNELVFTIDWAENETGVVEENDETNNNYTLILDGTCTETDGTQGKYVRGWTKTYLVSQQDYCIDASSIAEHTCRSGFVARHVEECEDGCNEGECRGMTYKEYRMPVTTSSAYLLKDDEEHLLRVTAIDDEKISVVLDSKPRDLLIDEPQTIEPFTLIAAGNELIIRHDRTRNADISEFIGTNGALQVFDTTRPPSAVLSVGNNRFADVVLPDGREFTVTFEQAGQWQSPTGTQAFCDLVVAGEKIKLLGGQDTLFEDMLFQVTDNSQTSCSMAIFGYDASKQDLLDMINRSYELQDGKIKTYSTGFFGKLKYWFASVF